jgi:hypothetical protein
MIDFQEDDDKKLDIQLDFQPEESVALDKMGAAAK